MNKKLIELMKSHGIRIEKVNPTAGDVHVNSVLTNMSVAYTQDTTDFVARKFFPVLPVMKQSDLFFKYDKGDFKRGGMQKRQDGTPSPRIDFRLSTEPYFCHVWSLAHDIGDQRRANEDNPLNADTDASLLLVEAGLITQDQQFALDYMQTGIWGSDYTGVAATPTAGQFLHWDDAAADPIGDVKGWKLEVKRITGKQPNKLLLTEDVYTKLSENPAMLDRVTAGGTNNVPARMLQQAITELFELEEILIMGSIANTAAEGAADAIDFIAQKQGILAYVNPNPAPRSVSAGYTFVWQDFYGSEEGMRVKRYRNEDISADTVEYETSWDNKVIAADCGVFLDEMIA